MAIKTAYPKCLVFRGSLFEFDPNKVQFSEPRKTQHGSYVLSMTYPVDGIDKHGQRVQGVAPVVLQTPQMQTTFGFSTDSRDGQLKAGIDLAFRDDAPQDVQDFKATMAEFDRILLAEAKDNKKKWFRTDKISDEIIEYVYCPIVRENIRKSDGQRFADTLRPKVRVKNGDAVAQAFDAAGNSIAVEEVTPRSDVRALLSNTGVWLSEQLLVASFEVLQVQRLSEPVNSGFAFVEEAAPATESMVMA